jgi:hypothetical protein
MDLLRAEGVSASDVGVELRIGRAEMPGQSWDGGMEGIAGSNVLLQNTDFMQPSTSVLLGAGESQLINGTWPEW